MRETYPIVKIPSEIKKIIDWNPLEDEQPKKPSLPVRPPAISDPTLPAKPVEPKIEKDSLGCLSVFFIVPIIFLFSLANNQKHSEFWGVVAWGLILAFIYFFFKIVNKNQESEQKYNIDRTKYPKELELWKDKCEEIKKKYEMELKEQDSAYKLELDLFEKVHLEHYKREVEKFEEYRQSEAARSKIQLQKIRRLKEYLSKIKNIKDFESNFKPTKGVSEQDFHDFIIKKLALYRDGDRVKLYTEKTAPNSYYLPDILFEFRIGNQFLRVDIEIDEPYVGKDGTPIHYIESNDKTRDAYFLINSWIVIRFAEEQIVKNPDECFHFILYTLHDCIFYGKKYWQEEIIPLLPIIKRWTEAEAHAMAFRRYRNTYIKKDFIENLPLEDEIKEPKPYESPYPEIDADEDNNLPF